MRHAPLFDIADLSVVPNVTMVYIWMVVEYYRRLKKELKCKYKGVRVILATGRANNRWIREIFALVLS